MFARVMALVQVPVRLEKTRLRAGCCGGMFAAAISWVTLLTWMFLKVMFRTILKLMQLEFLEWLLCLQVLWHLLLMLSLLNFYQQY